MTLQIQEIRQCISLIEREFGLVDDSAKSCCGVTLGQCHALVEIGSAKSVSLNNLAELLGLDKSTVSRTVDQLVLHALVSRQPDPASRRNVLISLTKTGQQLFDKIDHDMHQYYGLILTAIPVEKRQQVIESLQILAQAAAKVRCENE